MQGNSRHVLFMLVILLIPMMYYTQDIDYQISEKNELTDSFNAYQSEESLNETWNIIAGHYYSIQTNCISCTSTLSLNDVHLDSNKQNYSGQALDTGLLRLSIKNPNLESYFPSYLISISDNHENTRPAPGAQFPTYEPYYCGEDNGCIDQNSPLLTTSREDLISNDGRIISGEITPELPDYIAYNVSQGVTFELVIEHASSEIRIEAYYQNNTSEAFLGELSSSETMTNFLAEPNVQFLNFEHSGRVIFKLSTESINAVWSLGIVVHNASPIKTVDLADTSKICGHSLTTVIFAVNDTTSSIFYSTSGSVNYSYRSLVNSEWLYAGDGIFGQFDTHLFPLPTSSALKLTINAPVFCLEINSENFGDGNSLKEAPSLPPILMTTDNSSWPRIELLQPLTTGEFTNSIRDTSDVYLIEIDAWEDSVHFVMFEIIGDVNLFELELIEKNQEDWSDAESKIRTAELGRLSVAMEIPRGTHFLRVSMLNNTVDTPWGEYSPPTEYSIFTTYELVDEGEEPWFPPDENAKKWGNIARWFMGILFLLPALYLGIIQIRRKNFARQLLTKQQRLAWLKSRLDSGVSPKKGRKDLAKSLDAVATLDWEEACQTWGKPHLSYRTDNVAIACWNVDSRIAQTPDAWPIVVGVYIIDGNWEIAALKFDSPEGEAWHLGSVTPRFLYSGYEVFLDSMNSGNKTFISVELLGNANSVDIELNGRMNGEPFACRASKSLSKDEEE